MEKIKKSMRREDGFTLVELLAVIVILGIIVAIAVPSIGNVIAKSRSDADKAIEKLVLDAARLYATAEYDTVQPLAAATGGYTVTAQNLIDKGYLEDATETEKAKYGKVEITYSETASGTGGTTVKKGFTYTYTKPGA